MDELLDSFTEIIDSGAEKMSPRELRESEKRFNEILDRAIAARKQRRETAQSIPLVHLAFTFSMKFSTASRDFEIAPCRAAIYGRVKRSTMIKRASARQGCSLRLRFVVCMRGFGTAEAMPFPVCGISPGSVKSMACKQDNAV